MHMFKRRICPRQPDVRQQVKRMLLSEGIRGERRRDFAQQAQASEDDEDYTPDE